MRKINFQNEEYYHVYNRGVDKRDIFLNDRDYIRFLMSMREFNQIKPIGSLQIKQRQKLNSGPTATTVAVGPLNDKLVDVATYCLNSNHFHILLKQLAIKGVSEFIKRLSGGYTAYFNKKYNRSGVLFQGRFKAIHIKKQGYLWQLSAYINGNPEIHKIVPKAKNWQWSSYQDYLGLRKGTICDKEMILKDFEDISEYENFTQKIIQDARETKEELKNYLLE